LRIASMPVTPRLRQAAAAVRRKIVRRLVTHDVAPRVITSFLAVFGPAEFGEADSCGIFHTPITLLQVTIWFQRVATASTLLRLVPASDLNLLFAAPHLFCAYQPQRTAAEAAHFLGGNGVTETNRAMLEVARQCDSMAPLSVSPMTPHTPLAMCNL
jgi:hypothetical protein